MNKEKFKYNFVLKLLNKCSILFIALISDSCQHNAHRYSTVTNEYIVLLVFSVDSHPFEISPELTL